MEDGRKKCYCCYRGNHTASAIANSENSKSLDIDAALNELGMLSSSAVERESYLQEKKRREMRNVLAQSPPVWLQMAPTRSENLKIDTECQKDVPQQPPNSPVSPPFFIDHYKLREFDYHHEYENRPLQSRRTRCGRQRMLSGPDSLILRRSEERNNWHPYRIPRPRLRADRPPRSRTISASMHEPRESASSIIADTMDSASQMALTTKAMETMAIVENGVNLVNPETCLNLPRSRSLESLSRPLDVTSTAVDGVSERIENLHVT